jgi:hypothetical protein
VKNQYQIDHRDLFILPPEHRRELINGAVELFWRECELRSILTQEKLGVIISQSMSNLELRVKELKEQEEYELCYFLDEVIWGTHKRVQEQRKDKGVL